MIIASPDSLGCRWLRLAVAPLLVLALATPAVRAEDGLEDTLAHVDAVTIGISQITPDGVQCGLDPSRLLQVGMQALDNAGIAVRPDAATRITLSAITTQDTAMPSQPCATAVMLGAYRHETYFNADAGWVRSGYVVLWQRSILQLTPVASHPSGVAVGVRRLVAQFLEDYSAQHRRRTAAGGENR